MDLFKTEFSKQCSFTNRAINQKRLLSEMLTFWRRRGFICQQHEVCVVISKENVCMCVCLYTCICAGENLRTRLLRGCVCRHICAWRCVFLGVFSGRELSDMMTNVTLIMHTHPPPHTHKCTQVSWQVKAVTYFKTEESFRQTAPAFETA